MTHADALAAKDALIAVLLEQNALLMARVVELEAKLGLPPKGPDNSSVPPSGGHKPSGSSKARRKRKPHARKHRALHPNPTRTREVLARLCSGCGADVSAVAQSPCESYDRIEIPKIEPDVTRVVLRGGVCPCCAARFKAPAPEALEPGSPFGPELRAYAIYLRSVQGIPLARLSALFKDLFGLDISEGALVNILKAASPAFAGQAERFTADLKRGTVIASDETGLRVGKKNRWLWVFHHGPTALFVADQSRAKAVVEGFLGDWRPDYWISDRYGGQRGWAKKGHQFCLAHLIRDTRYHIEAGDTVVAPAFMDLLKHACAVGRKMIKIIAKLRHNLFVFVTNRAISPTNNGAERALRRCAIYRKITNGFRSQWAATLYADTRSAVETGRRRRVRAIEAIRITLAGNSIPSLA